EGRVPVEAVTGLAAAWPRADAGPLAGAQVAADHGAALALGVDDVGVVAVPAALEAVAPAQHEPVVVEDAARERPARPAPGAVVLHAAEDPVGPARVHGDVVELADGLGVQVVPVVAAVVAGVEAAVAADQQVPAVARVDPQGVLVRVDAAATVGL